MRDAPRVPMEQELSEWIEQLIQFRWLITIGALVIAVVANHLLPGGLPMFPLVSLTAGFAICNTLFFLLTRRLCSAPSPLTQHAVPIHLQVILDLVFLTALLHFLGGLETPLFSFYLIYVVLASTLLSKTASLAYAGLASFFYLSLLALEGLGYIPHYNLTGFCNPARFRQPIHIFTTSLTLTATTLLTAHFTSRIVASCRRKARELHKANLACEERAQELTELNAKLKEREQELMEANLACEMRAQELAKLYAKLKELDEAKSQFIYLVTHELRAPVAAMQSYLKLILEGYVPPEREREFIQKAEQRALDQLALINDLLDLARLEKPRAKAQVEPLDMGEVLCNVSDLMSAQAEAKGLSFKVEIAPNLSPVRANLEHMRQLWTNLISNAIKYTMPGGSVAVSLTEGAEGIVGRVQDTGIGISPEDLPRIFDEFYRAQNAKAMERRGTGLGLTIAKHIVETYGGKIWAESELGRGSTFAFVLPKEHEPTAPSST